MKTITILAVTAAGSLLLGACATPEPDAQGQPKRCYRTPPKAAYSVPVPCPKRDTSAKPSSELQLHDVIVEQRT